ncbi:MAG TPA: metal-dependent hydrolase [Polyangiaceae bacterium]|nr:metal-dependent hydrolase [Polyangiaceae bacterium]
MSFDVERGAGGLWNPKRPELSHTLNAFQLALPYLEPYFIDAIRQGVERIDDETTKADALAFCAQEANHSRQHKRYCRFLQQRYPRLAEFEYAIQQSLVKSRQDDSLEWRLAYTAGYEAITAQLSRWMLRSSEKWFDGADEHFAAMMMWHAAEEIEHRHVAWDVFRAVTKDYGLRAKGMFGALKKTYADMAPVVSYMLEVDGYAKLLDSRARRLMVRLETIVELGPVMFHYLAPGYHPSKEAEPPEFAAWLHRQEGVANGAIADESAER